MDATPTFPLLMLAGGAVCASVVAGAAWMVADDRTRRLGRQQRAEADRQAFRDKVQQVAAGARARREKDLAWHGLREFRVTAIVDECRDVKSFYLADPDGRALPAFHPGQFLTMHLPRLDGAQGKPVVRCYSLSDRPREEFYRVSVKRCRPPGDEPNAPPGAGSTALHTRVAVGDTLKVAAPRGDFLLPPVGKEPVVLIGAGIGVTPLLSMLLAQSHAGLDREAYLLLGMRNGQEFPFRQAVADLATQDDNVHAFVSYSRPTEADTQNDSHFRRGRIDAEYVRSVLPSPEFSFYLCGPSAMLEDVVHGLLDWGVPDDRIHFEAFGPSSVVRDSASTAAKAAVGSPVTFAKTGVTAQWSANDTTLLALAERLRVPIDAGCRVGNCGSCAARLAEGGVTAIKPPGAPTADGECLLCVHVPKGEVVIDA